MPTLDPPGIEWGAATEQAGHGRRPHPLVMPIVTFLAALVTTTLVLLLAGAIGT